ncbi:MAG TPA: TetR/AcrR family transcriptional regulator [Verrucomicrobiae bacterium]|nr:TetR/AcrR family transcriptional regulator [Verrucomicrobiae bacterium]
MRTKDPKKEKLIRKKAMVMIVEHGFDGLSLHKLARAAGLSVATFYTYFQDREDLILKIHAELSARMFELTLAGFDPRMDFAEGLRLQWINRARYFLKHPLEMHFMEQIRFSPLHERAMALTGGKFREQMMTFVRHAIERKQLVAVPVEVYWCIAFAPLYQLVKFHIHGKNMSGKGKFVLTEEALETTLRLVLKSLKP